MDIDQLTTMDSWVIGNAEKEVVDRLVKLCKKLESKIKDLIQTENTVNEELADLVAFKVSKILKDNDRAHKTTQDSIKAANKQIRHELDSANKGIKLIFKNQQDKLSKLVTQQTSLADTLNSTNLKLHRDLKPLDSSSHRDSSLFHTPDSMISKHSQRRSSGSSDWTPQTSDRPIQLARQPSRDTTPPLRDSTRVLDDRYPPKRPRVCSPDQRGDLVDKFDEFYARQMKEPRYGRGRQF